MKKLFTVTFLLACPLFIQGAFAPELFKGKGSPNVSKLVDISIIKASIAYPKNFKKLLKTRVQEEYQVADFVEKDERENKIFEGTSTVIMAFVRSKNNKEFYLHLDGLPLFSESDQQETIEEIRLNVWANKEVNQKNIFITREIRKKDVSEVCVEPVVCYWGKETKIKIPDVGKWANQYSPEIIPTNIKLTIVANPEYKK